MNGLLLLGATEFCTGTSEILSLVGWVLTIFKIIIPLIIIALGLIDLGKAAVSSKPEEIKKSAQSLAYRLVGGILIFFIPSLIMMAFNFIGRFEDATTGDKSKVNFDVCYQCIVNPWSDTCTSAVNSVRHN